MGVKSFLLSVLEKKSNDQVKFAAKNKNANFIACDFSVQRVVTLGVVLFHNQ